MNQLFQDVRRLHVMVVIASVSLLLLNQGVERAARRSLALESFERLMDNHKVALMPGETVNEMLENRENVFAVLMKALNTTSFTDDEKKFIREPSDAEHKAFNRELGEFRTRLARARIRSADVFEVTPIAARDRLREGSADQTLAVGGVRFYSGQVLFWGPAVILFLLLLLLVHVRQLSRQPQESGAYPWIAVFPDRLSQIVFQVSILVVPPLGTLSVFWAAPNLDGVARIGLWGLTLFVLATGLSVSYKATKWRAKLAQGAHVNTSHGWE